MRRRSVLLAALAIGAGLPAWSPGADAQGPERLTGQVILTVTGDVGRTNRGPRDEFADKLMVFHETRFDRAMEFDVAALERLGMHKLRVRYTSWPAAHEFEGPLLKDVLAAAGVTSGTVQPVAIDGYAAEIPYGELEQYPVVLALKMDGRWLPIGGAGPAWVVYPRDGYPALADQDDSKWVWGVTHIRVIKGQ
jgi:hypothetical protein